MIAYIVIRIDFFNRISFLAISANIIIIYITTLSIFTSLDRVLFISLILGLGKDFVFERIFGLNAMILILLAILFGKLKGSIYKEKWTIPIFYIVLHQRFICLFIRCFIRCI